MSSHILQINLHKSNVALVELNKYVKYVRRAEGDGDVPGGHVNVGGGSSIRTYVDKCRRAEVDGDVPGGHVNVGGGSRCTYVDKCRKKKSKSSRT